ncbi:LamG domain-containing protein [Akkermansiaceae bacterium]|nr:LamG domain-containing protein [Akkermansiaceae bacterium]
MMKTKQFSDLSRQEQEWLDAYLDGELGRDDFEAMQNRMVESADFRSVVRRYLSVGYSLEILQGESPAGAVPVEKAATRFPSLIPLALAASVAFFFGVIVMSWKQDDAPGSVGKDEPKKVVTPSAEGFAVVSNLFGVEWAENSPIRVEGDTLGSEVIRLASGTAEIKFFSGANMTVEGPAEILLKSAWEAECRDGLVRMQVPPAARGFKLHAPSTEIIDLGTEFGLSVRGGKGQIEVFDGEISIRHQDEQEQLLQKGESFLLPDGGSSVAIQKGAVAYPDASKFKEMAEVKRRNSREAWQDRRAELTRDERLLAYYSFENADSGNLVPNLAHPRNPDSDGAIILAEPVTGRWPGVQSALEFRRPGSRVRVNLPGEFPAFTFMSWVRIDSLDRQYNALFLGDGYENGEPHWQIREDGKLMLSVMVDDKRTLPNYPESRFHRVYFSPPIWDLSMSGQWLHIASVYDPGQRVVSHFVNGERVSSQEITEEFLVNTLRIGNGEIGNWGEPFKEDPSWAIRNLNGRMDEIAIYQSALSDDEIAKTFEESRSGRR